MLLGEPWEYSAEQVAAGTASEMGYYTNEDIVGFIYRAELQTIQDLGFDAFPSLFAVQNRTTVNGTAVYDLPGKNPAIGDDYPILQLISVELDAGAGYLVPCEMMRRDYFQRIVQDSAIQPSVYAPIAAYDSSRQIIVSPTPGAEAGAGKLVFRYVRVPQRRYKHYHGEIDAASTATNIIDAQAGFPTSFWLPDGGSSIRMHTGLLIGEERTVLSWTNASHTYVLNFALSAAPATGDHYLVGELSDLGDEYSGMVVSYAAYLGKMKDSDKDADRFLGEYLRQVTVMTRKPTLNVPSRVMETRDGDEF